MNNKAHLRPKDFDSNGDIIPMACKEEKGDLISREALRNVILNDRKLDGANANWEVNRILVHIYNAPTISPFKAIEIIANGIPFYQEAYQTGYEEGKNERPQGEWILNEGKLNNPICNQCGCKNDYVRNFCPVCGSDMRGEKE